MLIAAASSIARAVGPDELNVNDIVPGVSDAPVPAVAAAVTEVPRPGRPTPDRACDLEGTRPFDVTPHLG